MRLVPNSVQAVTPDTRFSLTPAAVALLERIAQADRMAKINAAMITEAYRKTNQNRRNGACRVASTCKWPGPCTSCSNTSRVPCNACGRLACYCPGGPYGHP